MHTNAQLLRWAAVIAAAALGLSGCRFGNYEVDPPGPGAIQGNYGTQISSLTLCATKNVAGSSGSSQQQTNCAQVSPDALSTDSSAYFVFQDTMTDPVFLDYDSSSGLFLLEPPNTPNPDFYWIVESDDSGDLFNPNTSYTPFSYLMPDTHPDCDFNMKYEASGTYGSGRIAMSFDVLFSPNGSDCSQLQACYSSASGCDANDNTIVQAEFGAAIQAGLMAVGDIPNLQDLEYRVSYQ